MNRLHRSIAGSDEAQVVRLLQDGLADPCEVSADGEPAIHAACRHVMPLVIQELLAMGVPADLCDDTGRQRFEAVITWGWETPQFYADWLSKPTPEAIAGLIGPCLNIGSPASEIAPGLVEVVRAVFLRGRAYTDRIKRHYSMFRQKVERCK